MMRKRIKEPRIRKSWHKPKVADYGHVLAANRRDDRLVYGQGAPLESAWRRLSHLRGGCS